MDKYMKKYLISLVNREMQIKTIRMVNIKNQITVLMRMWRNQGFTILRASGLPSYGSHTELDMTEMA